MAGGLELEGKLLELEGRLLELEGRWMELNQEQKLELEESPFLARCLDYLGGGGHWNGLRRTRAR